MENNINLAFEHLPEPFKSFNENQGKVMYNELLYKPEEEKKEDSDVVKSLTILHLAGNTKEFIEILEKNSHFLQKSGHMTIEDQSMIIEMLYDHAFRKDKLETKNIAKLMILLKDFLFLNYNKLNLVLDWRPCFNLLYAILDNSEVKMEMYSLAQKVPFYDLIEKVYLKMNKFFKQGSALEIFNEVKPFLFQDHPKFLANILTFSLLVPTKRFNTDEDEVLEWLPEMMSLWKKMPQSSYYRSLYIRLLSQVSQNFQRLDFSKYSNDVTYQFNLEITNQNSGGFRKSNCEKYFANYFVNTYKSLEHLSTDGQKESDAETSIDFLSKMYNDYLHPNNKFKNKNKLIVFIKNLAKSLCSRVRFEREKIQEDPEFKFKYLFLQQEDIQKFIKSVTPLLESALQGDTYLRDLSAALKSFLSLSCDEILGLFIFQNFQSLENLPTQKFIPILTKAVLGTLLNTETTSHLKYPFIQSTIEYLLEHSKHLETEKLKGTIETLNYIFSSLPILPPSHYKTLIESFSKNKDYQKYLRAIKKKRIMEYTFYKLTECLLPLSTQYFNTLSTAMNLGMAIKDQIVKSFWILLNSMQKNQYRQLVRELVHNADIDNSAEVLAKVVGNVVARDDQFAIELAQYYLDRVLGEEEGKIGLVYSNYAITQFNLNILSVILYQSRAAAESCFGRVFELVKILSDEATQEKEIIQVVSLAKLFTAPFTLFSVVYKGILSETQLGSEEYMRHLWENVGKFNCETLNFEIIPTTQDSITFFHKAITTTLLPWLEKSLTSPLSKPKIKTLSGILKSLTLNLQNLLPPTPPPTTSFLSHHYTHLSLPSSLLTSLTNLNNSLFTVTETLTSKIEQDPSVLRDSMIIKNIGDIYKAIVERKDKGMKEVTFKDVKGFYSDLEFYEQRRLEVSYVLQVGGLAKILMSRGSNGYDEENEDMKKAIERLYQFERYYCLIPNVHKQVKSLKDPYFVKYFEEEETRHIKILDKTHLEILKLIQQVKEETEKTVVTRDELIGLLIFFDKLCNSDILKRKEQVIRVLLLVYTGSSIRDNLISTHIWNISFRTIAAADRWHKYEPRLIVDNEDFYHVSTVFSKMSSLKTELATEIQECRKESESMAQDQRIIAKGIIESILNFSDNSETANLVQEDTRILGSLEIWLCYFDDDQEYLEKIQNYLIERLFVLGSSVRNKALSLCRKIIELKLKNHDFEKVVSTSSPSESDLISTFNRHLTLEENKFFDETQLGYHSQILEYTSYKGDTPFLKNSTEIQKGDLLYQKLAEEGNTFIKELFTKILSELNAKEDIKITNNESSQNDKFNRMKRMIAALIQKSKDTDTANKKEINKSIGSKIQQAHQSMDGAKYYNVFYQMIKYYGFEVCTNNLLPLVREYAAKDFKTIEHPHVTKSFLVDILSAVLLSCKYYYEGNEEVYNEALDLIFQLFSDCEQLDNTGYFQSSLYPALEERDPRRFEKFLQNLISNFTHSSSIKSRNTVAFTSFLCNAFKWKGLSYASQLIQKILDKDDLSNIPSDIEGIQPTLALLGHKNWSLICKVFDWYIANIEKHHETNFQDETIAKIHEFLHSALEDLSLIENTEETIFLLNNSLVNIIEIFKRLATDYYLGTLPKEFIILSLKISFFCIDKSVQKDTLDQSTALVGDTLNKIRINQEDANEIKDFLFQYSSNENWRIRENILYILEGLNSNLIKQGLCSSINIQDILPYFQDENIYVIRMAKRCLMTALRLDLKTPGSLLQSFLSKKSNLPIENSERSSDPSENAHIALSSLYSFGYKLPFDLSTITLENFLAVILYLAKISRSSSSELKSDILEYITRFKSIHQEMATYQPERFTDEQIEDIKEIMSVNSSSTLV